MTERAFVLIDDGNTHEVAAVVRDDGVRLSPAALEAATGWALKPQGLCRDETCIPVHAGIDAGGGDLAVFAELVGRPLALNMGERVAYLGVGAPERGAQLQSLVAPDFTLPDLGGRPHALSDYRGKKVLLLAYASW